MSFQFFDVRAVIHEMQGPRDNFLMRNATAIAIAAVTLLLGGMVLLFLNQGKANETARGWVNHTYEVRGHIQELMNKLQEAQIGQRGYLITGKNVFLDPYHDALRATPAGRPRSDDLSQHHSVAEEVDILRHLTADNPVQQQNIDDVRRITADFLAYLDTTIELRRRQGTTLSAEDIDLERGKALLDQLRATVRLMQAEEDHLLALRVEVDAAAARRNTAVSFYALGLFYVLILVAILTYQRMRKRSQQQMLAYTQQLEQSEEELKIQQEELKASNEEIEASNEELEEQNAQIRQQAAEIERSRQLVEEKAREVAQASRYKSEFLANMSHELRTPLNSLLILARSLASNEDGNLTEGQIEEARIIHNDGLELLSLINDILDLSKVEAGKMNLVLEDVSIEGIVHQLQQQFAAIARERGVAFPVDIESDLPTELHTDMQRVEQIMKNLLSNAFKFTSEGSVTLKVHQPSGAAGFVAFSVIDTGIGIDPSRLADIFEAFQQEDGSIDRHYGGTGLGLTIARKFAQLLGGSIQVTSEKGRGSTFTLMMPVNAERHSSASAPTTASTVPTPARTALRQMPRTQVREFVADDRSAIGGGDPVLLIVEDDPAFATTLMKIARKRGYKCIAAGDGKSALLLAMEEPVSAVLLDLQLPDMDGLQVLDHLKHNLRTRHIPVHVISGREEGGDFASLCRGAVGYLAKPAQRESIEEALAKMEVLLEGEVKQLLLVEDDPRNQVAVQTLLRQRDVHITVADTGARALELVRKQRFDCVILDLRLPDMSGFEWLERVERESEDQELPRVIVYTASVLTEAQDRELNRYTGSIIIKGAQSPERLLDEVTLFLHSVESHLSGEQLEMIRAQHDPDKVLQDKTVLLVDDDLRNTFALSKLLKKHGMQVVIADNGKMALDKLNEQTDIDVVLMDIMMPVMDGYQCMKAIRTLPTFANLPIIALTARAMPEEQDKCLAAGANDYLTKPVDVERLLTLLRVWLFKQELAA